MKDLFTSASVDQCESNYVYSPYIAEFWNTVSSLFMIYVGAFGAYTSYKCNQELRFVIAHAFLGIIGIGSTLFHSTLTYFGQIFDELSMIQAALFITFCVVSMDKINKFTLNKRSNFRFSFISNSFIILFFLLLLGIVITFTYLFHDKHYFIVMLISFSTLSFYNFMRCYQFFTNVKICKNCDLLPESKICLPSSQCACNSPKSLRVQKQFFYFSVITYAFAFVCQLSGEYFCPILRPLQLHAIQHVLCAITGHTFILYSSINRYRLRLKSSRIKQIGKYFPVLKRIYNKSNFDTEGIQYIHAETKIKQPSLLQIFKHNKTT